MKVTFFPVLCAGALLLVSAGAALGSKHATKSTPMPRGDTHHPRGWRFTLPKGDPVKGKAVFEKFECAYCHEIRGEFSNPVESAPELSQMGPLHPVEFFAEAIINPDAAVPKNYGDAKASPR